MNERFNTAKIQLADGRVAFDCLKLADIAVEGIRLAEYPNHVIVVNTKNTKYVFTSADGKVVGQAIKPNGFPVRYLATEQPVNIHGSTYGGSMIRIGFIGVEMHLEFSTKEEGPITTSEIQSVQVAPLEAKLMPHQQQAVDDMLSMEGFAV